MKHAKIILIALGLILAVIGILAVVGIVITIVKFLFLIALIVFGIAIVKKLSGKSSPQQLSEKDDDRELKESLRQLEEIKRRQQLTK
jgi:membrane protein implicated in regulation of membrane protease activity